MLFVLFIESIRFIHTYFFDLLKLSTNVSLLQFIMDIP